MKSTVWLSSSTTSVANSTHLYNQPPNGYNSFLMLLKNNAHNAYILYNETFSCVFISIWNGIINNIKRNFIELSSSRWAWLCLFLFFTSLSMKKGYLYGADTTSVGVDFIISKFFCFSGFASSGVWSISSYGKVAVTFLLDNFRVNVALFRQLPRIPDALCYRPIQIRQLGRIFPVNWCKSNQSARSFPKATAFLNVFGTKIYCVI